MQASFTHKEPLWKYVLRAHHWWTNEYMKSDRIKEILEEFSRKQRGQSLLAAIHIWKMGPKELLAYREATLYGDVPF